MTTENKTQITLEIIAEGLNGKLWEKGSMRRVYLDRGYNTKKMSTKTYVYQHEDGSFGVSCYIECPSQPMEWIRSQQADVVDSVTDELNELMAEIEELSDRKMPKLEVKEVKFLEETPEVMAYISVDGQEPVWFTEQIFKTQFGLELTEYVKVN